MSFERWNYLAGLLLTAAFAFYQFRAAELDDLSREQRTRVRLHAWVAVCLAMLALYLLIVDPWPRYAR